MSKGKRLREQRKELMSQENPSPEEVAAMLNELGKEKAEERQPSALEIACGGRLMLVQSPADITLKDGRIFRVEDLQAWGYTPFGLLAVGNFEGDPSGEDNWESRLFAADVIHDIQFNKARYEEIIEEIKAEEQELQSELDAEPEGVVLPEADAA